MIESGQAEIKRIEPECRFRIQTGERFHYDRHVFGSNAISPQKTGVCQVGGVSQTKLFGSGCFEIAGDLLAKRGLKVGIVAGGRVTDARENFQRKSKHERVVMLRKAADVDRLQVGFLHFGVDLGGVGALALFEAIRDCSTNRFSMIDNGSCLQILVRPTSFRVYIRPSDGESLRSKASTPGTVNLEAVFAIGLSPLKGLELVKCWFSFCDRVRRTVPDG